MNTKTIISLVSVAVLLLIVGGLVWALQENGTLPPSGTPTATSTPTKVLPYGTVTLAIGESATFAGVSIRALSIEEDSRCPSDVQCIQAGTVRVETEVVTAAGASMHTVGLGKTVTTAGFDVALSSVLPSPVSTIELTPKDYRLTFTVLKSAVAGGECFIGGCSSQICSDQPDAVSTCEYRAEYACYQTAQCERQASGQCGWTDTATLRACLLNPPPL